MLNLKITNHALNRMVIEATKGGYSGPLEIVNDHLLYMKFNKIEIRNNNDMIVAQFSWNDTPSFEIPCPHHMIDQAILIFPLLAVFHIEGVEGRVRIIPS